MTVYCEQCGHRNEKGARFCEVCGTKLSSGEPAKNAAAGGLFDRFRLFDRFNINGKKQKIVAALIAAVIVVGGVILGLALSLNTSVEASEYDDRIALGEQCVSEGDYDGAQLAFNEAIKIDPHKAEAYDRSIDAYKKAGDADRAEKVKQKRDEKVKEEKPDTESASSGTTITASYRDVILKKKSQGTAVIDEEYAASEGKKGLVSAAIADTNGDDIDELVTVSCLGSDAVVLNVELYGYKDEKAVKLDDEKIDFDDAACSRGKYDLFLKTNDDDDVYLYVQRDKITGTDDRETGGALYRLEDGIEQKMDSAAISSSEKDTFVVNDDTRYRERPEQPDGEVDRDAFTEQLNRDIEWWTEKTDSYLEKADLECSGSDSDKELLHEKIDNNLPEYDEDDDSQTHLCHIKRGKEEDLASGDVLYIEEYTELSL